MLPTCNSCGNQGSEETATVTRRPFLLKQNGPNRTSDWLATHMRIKALPQQLLRIPSLLKSAFQCAERTVKFNTTIGVMPGPQPVCTACSDASENRRGMSALAMQIQVLAHGLLVETPLNLTTVADFEQNIQIVNPAC